MKLILFGATGMVGQGVLREALADPAVERVLAVGRSASGQTHPKLRDLVHRDMSNFAAVEGELAGYDACIFAVGVSVAGMSEADYRRVTYDIAVAAGTTLSRIAPGMTFVFVSGQGVDASGRERAMWARTKGDTENALRKLPFKAVYAMRPGAIQPRHGIRSRTGWYNVLYKCSAPIYPLLISAIPNFITDTERLGRTMLRVAKNGAPKPILTNREINEMAATA